MKIASVKLREDLIALINQHLGYIAWFQGMSMNELNSKVSSDSWSILECVEHLNLYGYFYLPEITKRMKEAHSAADPIFKSGCLGNYFANLMWPKTKLNKMKTFKVMDPINSKLDKKTLEVFVHQQHQLLDLLEQSSVLSLNKVKTNISISKWIKLKLGDTFRIVIYHQERHLKQAERTYKAITSCG